MKKGIKITVAVVLLAAVICFGVIPLAQWFATNAEEEAEYANLEEKYLAATTASTPGEKAGTQETKRKINWNTLTADNPDAVGWIAIPDTPISYPVVEDKKMSLKYLKTSFFGHKNASGAIFTLGENDYLTPQKNVILYGHHMGRGREHVMFGPLVQYKEQAFFKTHDTIFFDTPYREGTYRVFAAFNVKANGSDYERTEFAGEDDFLSFVSKAKELTGYDTGVEVLSEDDVITLSTCDASFARRVGRFVVMAKRIRGE